MLYFNIMEMKKRSTFVLGAAILAAAGLICKVIGVLIRIWAYAVIKEEGMVYYEAVFPFYSWLLIISSSGVPTAISRMVARSATLGDWANARRILKKSVLMLGAVGLVTTALMYFGAPWFAVSFIGKDESYVLVFKALAPALFFVSVMCAYRGYLQGMQHMAGTALSQLCEQVVKAGAGLLLASRWVKKGPVYGAAGILVGIVISEILALGVVVLFRFKNRRQYFPIGASENPQDTSPVISTLLSIAVPITLGASVIPITSMLDVRMIFSRMSSFMTEADVNRSYVALSTNVRSLINLPASFTQALSMSLVPAISAAQARKDISGMHSAAGLGLKLSMAIGMPCAAGLFVLGGPIIEMLFRSITAESLAIAVRIMRVASVSVVFISLVQTMTGELQGIGKHRVAVYCLLAGGISKVVLNYFLLAIPSVNILGASISNIACYGVAGVLDLFLFMRYSGYRPAINDVFLKPAVCSLIMGGAVLVAYKLLYRLHPGTLVTLIAVVIGIAVYGVLCLVLRLFTSSELENIPGGHKLKQLLRIK